MTTTTWPTAVVRSLVHPTATWYPATMPRTHIRYVDVSAVSRERLAITAAEQVPANQASSRARKIVQAGDTLFATIRPGLARIAQVPSELDGEIASTAFCVLRPNREVVLPDYLFFAVTNRPFVERVADLETGASYPAVRDSDVLDQMIPLPPLPVQGDIAATMNCVRKSLLLEDGLAAESEILKRAAMRELFTRGLRGEPQKETEIGPIPSSWDLIAFEAAREWLQYGTSTRCTIDPVGYPVLRIPNVGSGRVNADDLKYCDLPDDEAAHYLLVDGDLLFIRTNGVLERLGSCAVYAGEPDRALFASYLIRARPKPTIVPKFVAYFYGSELGTSLVAGRATPAADGKYNLNTGTIDSLPLPLPKTREEQQEVVAILDAIDAKIDLHRRKKAVLEELFKSLLHKLMTGEVRVADLDLSALPAPEEARS